MKLIRFSLISLILLGCCLNGMAATRHPSHHKQPTQRHQPPPAFISQPAVRTFIAEMHQQHGLDPIALQKLFSRLRPIPAVIQAIRPPRDPKIRSWQEYRLRFVEPRRIERGLKFWQAHTAELQAATLATGVPEEYVVAIIGIESIYGAHTGNFGTLAALATLAFDYPRINPATDATRAALFRRELEALLLLAQEAQRNPLSYRGSYAGALGLPQFLPSSIRQYGRDGDGDGRIDLETEPADAIASVAYFLQQHGWEKEGAVVARVRIEGDRHTQLIDEGIRPKRKPSELAAFGVTPEGTGALPEQASALIDLVTPNQPTEYWLGFQNFFVITRYNRSSFYAMAVHDLAQALRLRMTQKQSSSATTTPAPVDQR